MSLNEVAKMRVIFKPLIVFLSREPLIPETTKKFINREKQKKKKKQKQKQENILNKCKYQ